MNNQTLQQIANEVVAVGYATNQELLHAAVVRATDYIDFQGVTLSKESLAVVSSKFNSIYVLMDTKSLNIITALGVMCDAYEEVIMKERITASIKAGALSEETADSLLGSLGGVEKNSTPAATKTSKGLGLLGGVKNTLKGILNNTTQDTTTQAKSYGKLDTVHDSVGKAINVVHGTNNIVIDGTATIGCGAVNVVAGLAKSGILATSVVAKEVNKLGHKTGHKLNDGAYEIGKSIVDKKVSKDRDMSIGAIYKL